MLVAAASYELLAGSGATGGFDVAARAGKDKRQLAAARLQAAEQHLNSAVKLSHGAGGVHASLCAAAKAALALQSALVAGPTDERAQAHLTALAGLAADAEGSFARDKSTRELAGAAGAAAPSVSIAFVPVLLAQAAARFATGDFAGARALYARVVREAPAVAAAPVRTALGMCLHKLGYAEAARAAFSRALQLQPDAPLALTYLAALESARLVAAAATTAAAAPAASKGAASNGGSATAAALAAPAPLEAAASEIRLRARVHEMLRRATDAAAVTAGAGAGSAAAASSGAATSTLAGLPAQTLLELSHSAFERFAPLTTAPAGSAGGAPEPVTAAVTLGSRWVVFSADVRKLVGKSETLRFLVRKPAAPGAAAVPVAVPLRLVGAQPVTLVAASALAPLSVAHPFLQGLEPSTLVCVGKARSPWPFPSATGVPVTGIDVERALAFAKAALEAAQTVEVRAEAHYALARASHAKASYVDAGIEYRNCLTLRPDFAPAVYGNAQVAMTGKRPDDAAALLGRVLAARPDDRSALRTLAFLRMQTPGAQAEALESARRAYDAAPADAVAAALYAMQLARQDTPHAIARAYKVVESIGERQTRAGLHVPAAVHNNCGVLAMRQAAHEATLSARRKLLALAEEQLMRGVEVVALEMLPGAPAAQRATQEVRSAALFSAAGLTLAFNLARLDEVQGRVGTAEAAYRRILEAAPHYFDGKEMEFLRFGV
jgi:tetratricopeptide (TPR) repeat protein